MRGMRLSLSALRLRAGAGSAAALVLALLASLWHVAWLERVGEAGGSGFQPGAWTAGELVPATRAEVRAEAVRAAHAVPRLDPPAPDDPASDPGASLLLVHAPAAVPTSLAVGWPAHETRRAYAPRAPPGPA
jgi:hypothetical protein